MKYPRLVPLCLRGYIGPTKYPRRHDGPRTTKFIKLLWDNLTQNLLNSVPVSLSIVLVLSESYLQTLRKTFCMISMEIYHWTKNIPAICQ